MADNNYTTSFTVDQSPEEVYNAINNVRDWWSDSIEGDTDKAGAVFFYHFQDIHKCTIKVEELVPGKKVHWRVLHNYFKFVKDNSEWTGTDVIFEISEKDGKTEIHFTHVGLVPEYECYNICVDGWHTYINGSLEKLIATGKGNPNVGDAVTDSEKEMTN